MADKQVSGPIRVARSVAFAYDKQEDRIRVMLKALNPDEEFDLWLTRRLALPLLMRVTQDANAHSSWTKGAAPQMVPGLFDAERRMSLVMTQNRMSRMPGPDAPSLPRRLPSAGSPALITGVQFKRAPDDRHALVMGFDDQQIALPLSRQELLRLLTMLGGEVTKAGWTAHPANRTTPARKAG
jgi:hypothetical protein